MKNLLEEQVSDNILKSFGVDQLQKSKGEGSKGGKVIGHTRSGKPIYANFDHPEHKDFTEKDHEDAEKKHVKTRDKLMKEKGVTSVNHESKGEIGHHHNESYKHFKAMQALYEKRDPGYKKLQKRKDFSD